MYRDDDRARVSRVILRAGLPPQSCLYAGPEFDSRVEWKKTGGLSSGSFVPSSVLSTPTAPTILTGYPTLKWLHPELKFSGL